MGQGELSFDDVVEKLLETPDGLRVVIDGHKVLDAELAFLITERLIDPHLPELRRLRFATKLDLVVGLRLLDPGSRPAWLAFNRLRNRLAHRLEDITDSDAAELLAALSPRHQHALDRAELADFDSPARAIASCVAAFHAEATSNLARTRDATVTSQTLHDMAVEVVGGPKAFEALVRRRTPRDDRLEAVIARARAERKREGRY